MYSKDELLSKDISELEDIANNIGAQTNPSDSKEVIVYTILDKQAEVEGNKNPLGTKRKRTRITKKETDKVYSVKGATGENFDLKKSKTTPATSQLPLFEEPVADSKDSKSAETESAEEATPKKRTRRTKAQKQADELAKEAAETIQEIAEMKPTQE